MAADTEYSEYQRSLHEACLRAESRLATLVPNKPVRRPVVIEFAGTPKAGKTSTMETLQRFLRRNGIKVKVVTEQAAVCPLADKVHYTFNIWTACHTLIGMLEGIFVEEPSYDVVLLDRGLFDAIAWIDWLDRRGNMFKGENKKIRDFLTLRSWSRYVDLVFLFTVDPTVAMNREAGVLATTKTGRIMNKSSLEKLNSTFLDLANNNELRLKKVIPMDTTTFVAPQTFEIVVDETMKALEQAWTEQILCIPRDAFNKLGVHAGMTLDTAVLDNFMQVISEGGKFMPRTVVEENDELVQPIPCLVLQYHDKFLLLRRSEPNRGRLHDRFVIWAGGHVRDTDTGLSSWKTMENALLREIDEELRTAGGFEHKLWGLVFDASQPRSRRHVGVVYLAVTTSEDIGLAAAQTEFKERKGISLSASFQEPEVITKQNLEPWSRYILEALGLLEPTPLEQSSLFEE